MKKPYQAHPRHPLTGKQFSISARTARELEALLHHVDMLRNELRLQLKSPAEVDRSLRRLTRGVVTVRRAGLAYAESPVAANTARRVRSFLAPGGTGALLADKALDELDAPALDAWIRKLAAARAASTIGLAWRTLRSIARFAASRGWIGAAPWGAWRPVVRGAGGRRVREAARSAEEVARLLDAARALDLEAAAAGRYAALEAMVGVAVLLGLRQGEIAGLRWEDAVAALPERSDGVGAVRIARQYDGAPVKSRAPARVLLAPPELFDLLDVQRARLQARGWYAPAGPIFPHPKRSRRDAPKAFTSGEVLANRHLRAAVERAGLPDFQSWSAQSLRDTFATLESSAHAGDLPQIAQRTRHASLGSLVRYLQSRSRELALPGFAPGRPATVPALGPHED